jgi:hypothetical protein
MQTRNFAIAFAVTRVIFVRFVRSGQEIMPICAVLEDRGEPRRTIAKFFDLDWFFHNDAVRPQPTAGPNHSVLHLAIPDATEIRLHINCYRDGLEGFKLKLCHLHKSSLRSQVIAEGRRIIIRVALAPKAEHHEIHELRERIVIKLGGQQSGQFAEGLPRCRPDYKIVLANDPVEFVDCCGSVGANYNPSSIAALKTEGEEMLTYKLLNESGAIRAGVFLRFHPSKSEQGLLMYSESLAGSTDRALSRPMMYRLKSSAGWRR